MPSFSIEAEGETNPLTVTDVLKILTDASSVNASQQSLQVAAQQLANWEKTPGYFSLLQDVYGDFSLSEAVRFQAIIQLKNGIDKYWRKSSHNALKKAEKDNLKEQAIAIGIREPKQNLALQNALMLAKVVRYEFPHDWPDVISTLIHHVRNAAEHLGEPGFVSNTLCIALQIIKELASGRLQRTKKSLQAVAPELLNVLAKTYIGLVQVWSSGGQLQDMVNSLSALKILRRLLIAGFEHPHREAAVKEFWDLIQQDHQVVWTRWKQSNQLDKPETQLLTKHLFQYFKLYLDMARTHASSFVSLDCMGILNRSWVLISGDDAKAVFSFKLESANREGGVDDTAPIEKLTLKALLLFRACIKMVFHPTQTFKYQHPEDKIDKKTAVDQIRATVFTDGFVLQLMELLVTQYFMLRPQDLQEWEEEPDEWEKREEEITDAWEFSVRSCSEKLFLDLVINFRSLLVPRLLQVIQQYATLENQDILLKDSLYSAIGIASVCIEDVFDFDSFIKTTLVPEAQVDRPNYNLLRRRISILLGQWVPIKPEALDRRAIYQIFAFFLSPNDKLNDQVVRVTAGRQFRLILEPFEFKFEDFEPFVSPILSNTLNLISETELSETKMALLETVRVAVTRLESKVEPYAQDIMSVLPSLWAQSGEEHLIKQAILTMITAIVTSLGQKDVTFHNSVLSLIYDAVQVGSEAIVYLLEDALDLWAAILQQTTTNHASPELLVLVQNLIPLLELGSEHLRQCLELVESYTILSPTTVLAPSFLVPLFTSLKGLLKLLSSNRARDASLAPHVVENLISTIATTPLFDAQSRVQAIEHLVVTMSSTGYLEETCIMLREAYEYHQDPRPNRKPPDILGVGETTLFSLLSRFALFSPDIFVQSISKVSNSVDWLVVEWIGNFDSIGDTSRKKLQTLAITNLLSINPTPSIMLESLQSLMNIWTDMVIELADGAADEDQGDYLWSGSGPLVHKWPGETPENGRKREISNLDPTYTVHIRGFIIERLNSVIGQLGGPHAFEQAHLSRIDPVVLKSFADLKLM